MMIMTPGFSQHGRKTSMAVLNIDSKAIEVSPLILGNLVRLEAEKLKNFEIRDRYDVQDILMKNNIPLETCYGKDCIVEAGKFLQCEKMLTGTVEKSGKYIVINLKVIDVATAETERSYLHEFLYLPDELPLMIRLAVADMFHHTFDLNTMNKLSKKDDFESSYNMPDADKLFLGGPRMGFVAFTGHLSERLRAKKEDGGYDAFPVMFQFGYQFEKQYLNEGKVQALFECIPMITGLDQGYFFGSITLLHGIRSNVSGWEFAFGPTFNIVPMARGYYDANGSWKLESDYAGSSANPFDVKERFDRRGDFKLTSQLVFAAGKTFRSGKLNIPVNMFLIPGKDGFRFGISFGFNSRNSTI